MDAALNALDGVTPHVDEVAHARGEALRDAHQRVREAARAKGLRYAVEPLLPADLLGTYVYVPMPQAAQGGQA